MLNVKKHKKIKYMTESENTGHDAHTRTQIVGKVLTLLFFGRSLALSAPSIQKKKTKTYTKPGLDKIKKSGSRFTVESFLDAGELDKKCTRNKKKK